MPLRLHELIQITLAMLLGNKFLRAQPGGASQVELFYAIGIISVGGDTPDATSQHLQPTLYLTMTGRECTLVSLVRFLTDRAPG